MGISCLNASLQREEDNLDDPENTRDLDDPDQLTVNSDSSDVESD